jgi:hypothetical protein
VFFDLLFCLYLFSHKIPRKDNKNNGKRKAENGKLLLLAISHWPLAFLWHLMTFAVCDCLITKYPLSKLLFNVIQRPSEAIVI